MMWTETTDAGAHRASPQALVAVPEAADASAPEGLSTRDLEVLVSRSATLPERLRELMATPDVPSPEGTEDVEATLRAWREAVAPGGNPEHFLRRLRWEGWDESLARAALEDKQWGQGRPMPSWALMLSQALVAEAVPAQPERSLDAAMPLPFEEVLLPLVRRARRLLAERVGELHAQLSPEAHGRLERSLLRSLCGFSSQVLYLEFSVFRACRVSPLERFMQALSSQPSREHYLAFVRELGAGGLRRLLLEYPVLARFLGTFLEQWLETAQELLLRLRADRQELARTFGEGREPGPVVSLDPGLSDRHHRGRHVMRVTFASGLSVVYKPRGLEMEDAFHRLMGWCMRHGAPQPLRAARVLPREGYGWMELVVHQPCTRPEQVEEYYRHCGGMLALLHVLVATDIHCENVIAEGPHPVLVDLETLLHPHESREEERWREEDGTLSAGNEVLLRSLLRTHLVPRWAVVGGQARDRSALGIGSGVEPPERVPAWLRINTDSMELTTEEQRASAPTSLPMLAGEHLSPEHHVPALAEGLRRMSHWLLLHREQLGSPRGPLQAFAGLRSRFLPRDTQLYAALLERLLTAGSLRSGVAVSLELESLARDLVTHQVRPQVWPLLQVEQEALLRLDIPYFQVSVTDEAIYLSEQVVTERCLRSSGLAAARQRLRDLSEEELRLQLDLLRGAMAARFPHSPRGMAAPREQGCVEQAVSLAEALSQQAVRGSTGDAGWIAPCLLPGVERYQLGPVGHSLYEGGCGVALFMAAVARASGRAEFQELALAALAPTRRALQAARPGGSFLTSLGVGGATGLGSIVYAFTRVADFLGLRELLAEARLAAGYISDEALRADTCLDVISGTAGALLGLLALYQRSPDARVLKRARACGERLLQQPPGAPHRLVPGFSHGLAGMALALARLFEITGQRELLAWASEAVELEDQVLSPEHSNWASVVRGEPEGGKVQYRASWCHGAPGIGLARVAGLGGLDTSTVHRDISMALRATQRSGLAELDTLCCGSFGRIELLLTAGRRLGMPRLEALARDWAEQVLHRARQCGGFRVGLGEVATPGLFQGLAGVGYALLRLEHPELFPSVLCWE